MYARQLLCCEESAILVRALFDYTRQHEDDMTFAKGDLLELVNRSVFAIVFVLLSLLYCLCSIVFVLLSF